VLQTIVEHRRPLIWVASGMGSLIGFSLTSAAFPPDAAPPLVAAGLIGFFICARRALILWRADEIVFDHKPRRQTEHGNAPGFAAAVLLAAVAAPALSQQTIFNVPTADVLDKGKVYLEEDDLWRPQDRHFAVFTLRGVYGFGSRVEAGFNFGGFTTPGRSTPTATAAIKWQPLRVGDFALTAGAHGEFFLRGSEDGDPAGHFYVHGSYAFPTNTRVTAGGWVATAGYAAKDSRTGMLVGFEQKLHAHLNLIADWYSGHNGIGYFTPGFSSTWRGWTIYAGYSFKNSDSKGNAFLGEIGVTF